MQQKISMSKSLSCHGSIVVTYLLSGSIIFQQNYLMHRTRKGFQSDRENGILQ